VCISLPEQVALFDTPGLRSSVSRAAGHGKPCPKEMGFAHFRRNEIRFLGATLVVSRIAEGNHRRWLVLDTLRHYKLLPRREKTKAFSSCLAASDKWVSKGHCPLVGCRGEALAGVEGEPLTRRDCLAIPILAFSIST